MRYLLHLVLGLGFVFFSSFAAQADSCDAVYENNIRSLLIDDNSFESLHTIYDNYCSASGESKSSNSEASLDTVVKAVPVKFAGKTGSALQRTQNFCKTYNEIRYSDEHRNINVNAVSVAALEQYNRCREIEAKHGVKITHSYNAPGALTVFFDFANTTTVLRLEHIAVGPNTECGTTAIDTAGKLTKLEKQAYELKGNFSIICTRTGTELPDKSVEYEATWIEIGTTFGPYSIPIQQDIVYNNELATDATQKIDRLNSELSATQIDLSARIADVQKLQEQLDRATPKAQGWNTYFVDARQHGDYKKLIEDFVNSNRPRLDGIAASISGGTNFYIWARPDHDGPNYELYPFNPETSWVDDIKQNLMNRKMIVVGFNNAQNNRLWILRVKD